MFTNTITLPSGEYIIIDPCYVMPDDAYQKMIDTIYSTSHMEENQFTYKGKTMVVFGTAYGDGGYPNTFNNNNILVDSGQIAIIPTSVLTKKVIKSNANCSVVVTFENNVQCRNNDGIMEFGNITVDTRPEEDEEDEEDNWYEDEDEDEDEDY